MIIGSRSDSRTGHRDVLGSQRRREGETPWLTPPPALTGLIFALERRLVMGRVRGGVAPGPS